MATTRESPPTRRIIRVLDLLASDPRARLNLTTIARSLDLSPSTCLGILQELAVARFVVRHPDLTYSLGGSLIAMGAAAREGRPGIALAREELKGLSAELGCVCTASTIVGDQIVVLEAAGSGRRQGPAVGSGSVFPFVAPVGPMFAAWAPDESVEAWLDRAPLPIDQAKRDRLWEVVRTAREQGYHVQRLTNVEARLHEFLSGGAGHTTDRAGYALATAMAVMGERDYVRGELDHAARSSVSVVCAPCFDEGGLLELVIGVYVMATGLDRARVAAIADRVLASAVAVTDSIGGHDPWQAQAAGRVAAAS
jgi:DNA-binding IclR family transcriptional regulator